MKIDKQKEFNKMFTGLGVARSVTISKPRHTRYIGFFIAAACLVVVIILGFWHVSRSNLALAKNLSSDTRFYLYLKIPNTESVHSKLRFWDSSFQDMQLNRLYTNFVQANLGEFFTETGGNSFFSGVIEIAKLDTGEVVLTSELKNKKEWLSLMFIDDEYAGQIVELEISANNWLQSISSQENWFWYIDKGRLYFVSSKSAREKISFNLAISISDMISSSRKDIGIFYANDISGIFDSENPYINILAGSVVKPFILYACKTDNQVIFRTNDLPKISENLTENSIKKLYQASDFGVKAHIGDIKSFNIVFEENVLRILSQIEGFLKETHSIDIEKLDRKSAFSNLAIFISPKNNQKIEENHWAIVSESLELDILEQFGMSSFAKQHPIRVQNVLRDGSVMIEMRAEEEGLLWEDFPIVFNNQDIVFRTLQAQGEGNGYFAGFVPGLGSVLTNSEAVLNKILEIYSNISKISANNECKLDFSSRISSHFDASFLSDDLLMESIIDYLNILSLESGDLYGCVVFNED